MKNTLIISFIGLSLVACSSVAIKDYDDEDTVLQQKYKEDIAIMSEYDKQRYYNQHHLGVVKPERVKESIREQRRK